jgi:hypothetical protein
MDIDYCLFKHILEHPSMFFSAHACEHGGTSNSFKVPNPTPEEVPGGDAQQEDV